MKKSKPRKNPINNSLTIIENKDKILEFLIKNKKEYFRVDFYYGYCFGQLTEITNKLNNIFFDLENDDCGTKLSFDLSEIDCISIDHHNKFKWIHLQNK